MATKAIKVELVAFLEPGQTFKMELFVKVVNGIKPLIIFTNGSILNA